MPSFPKSIGLFIICRTHSKRFPNKIKKKILSKSILEILLIRLIEKFPRSNIVICTSIKNKDNFFLNILKKYKIKLFFGNDQNLFKRYLNCMNKFSFNHFVRITGDNPFTDLEAINKIAIKHLKMKSNYTFTRGLIRGTRPEIFSKKILLKYIKLAENPLSSEYLTFYFHREFKFQHCVRFKKIFLNQEKLSISIDSPKNLKNIKKIFLSESDFLLNRKKLYKKIKSYSRYFKKKLLIRIPLKTKRYNTRLKTDPKKLKYIKVNFN